MRMHTSRSRRNFARTTIADMQTINCGLYTELGSEVETGANAGPHVQDFTNFAHPGMSGALYPTATNLDVADTSDQPRTYGYSRELTFDIIDGLDMGPNYTQDYGAGTGPGINVFGKRAWSDCDYVVIRDLQWEVTLAPPTMLDAYIYGEVNEDNNDEEDPLYHWPRTTTWDNLGEFADAMVTGLIEAEGGDQWSHIVEMLRAHTCCSLLRLPMTQPIASIADLYGNDEEPRHSCVLGPLGYLRFKEMEDPIADLAINWDPESELEGTVRSGPSEAFHRRMYRSWEPYDQLRGVILARHMYQQRFWIPSQTEAQEDWALDVDGVDAFEPMGKPNFPTNERPQTLRIRGRFPGEIVVSPRRPMPLVLTLQTCPVRLHVGAVAGGGTITYFYRHKLNPIRWHITANVKAR